MSEEFEPHIKHLNTQTHTRELLKHQVLKNQQGLCPGDPKDYMKLRLHI